MENSDTAMLARQVDVRDVARAHVLAAEVVDPSDLPDSI